MKKLKLTSFIVFTCLQTVTWAQSMGDAIWGVPFTTNKKEAKALIKSKTGYSPNRESKESFTYQYKNILGIIADNVNLTFSNGKLSECMVIYKAGNITKAFSIIDSLYPQVTQKYGYPLLTEPSDKPLSVQMKNDKDYPHIVQLWMFDDGMLNLMISDSMDVMMTKMWRGSNGATVDNVATDSIRLGPASFWCITPGMKQAEAKAQMLNDKKMEPAKEEKGMLEYAVDEFDDVPSEAVSLYFEKGVFTGSQILFPANDKNYKEVYDKLASKLEAKYGLPETINNEYQIKPTNEDEAENLRMLKQEQLTKSSSWEFKDGKRISINVDKDLKIEVFYWLNDLLGNPASEF